MLLLAVRTRFFPLVYEFHYFHAPGRLGNITKRAFMTKSNYAGSMSGVFCVFAEASSSLSEVGPIGYREFSLFATKFRRVRFSVHIYTAGAVPHCAP